MLRENPIFPNSQAQSHDYSSTSSLKSLLGTATSIIFIFGWISLVISTAVICRNIFPSQKELSRKIIHIGSGTVIPWAWVLGISSKLAIPIASIITLGLLMNHQWRLIPAMEDVNRQSYGTIAYGLSITLLLIFLWPENAAAVCAGVLVMSFGDGLAGLIGPQWQSPDWAVFGQRKSIAGTLTMALAGLFDNFSKIYFELSVDPLFTIIISIDLSWIRFPNLSTISGIYVHPLLLIGIAWLGCCLEQIGPWGIDNLTVPIGVAYAWLWFSN